MINLSIVKYEDDYHYKAMRIDVNRKILLCYHKPF